MGFSSSLATKLYCLSLSTFFFSNETVLSWGFRLLRRTIVGFQIVFVFFVDGCFASLSFSADLNQNKKRKKNKIKKGLNWSAFRCQKVRGNRDNLSPSKRSWPHIY